MPCGWSEIHKVSETHALHWLARWLEIQCSVWPLYCFQPKQSHKKFRRLHCLPAKWFVGLINRWILCARTHGVFMWAHRDNQRITDQDPDYLYNRNAWGSWGCIWVVFYCLLARMKGSLHYGASWIPAQKISIYLTCALGLMTCVCTCLSDCSPLAILDLGAFRSLDRCPFLEHLSPPITQEVTWGNRNDRRNNAIFKVP